MAKRLIPISLAANVLLAGALASVTLLRPVPRPERESVPLQPLAPARGSPSPPAPSSAAAPVPFRWSQIEASDYPTYIANLRGIACPEPTIRDIITADVENLYVQKRGELRTRGLEALELACGLDTLRQQQGALLVRLLGAQSNPGTASEQAGSAPAAEDVPADAQPTTPVALPVALLPPDPALKLTPEQKEEWEQLTREFIEAVGGPNQDPNKPEYLKRWNQARSLFDARFKIVFGEELYLKAALDLPMPAR